MRNLALVQTASARDTRPATLRIAVASSDGQRLDSHFGSARRFVFFEVGATESTLRSVTEFDDYSDESGAHGDDSERRIASKIEALAGCDLLFVLAIGGPVAAQVLRANTRPMKMEGPQAMTAVITRVQTLIKQPPPWLRSAIHRGAERSMSFLDEEEAP